MVQYLKHFLVFKEGGKVIFSTSSSLIKDSLLFGGFLEALNSFYNLSLEDNLRLIEGDTFRIIFLTKMGCQFVGISLMNVDRDKSLDELAYFSDRFIEFFPEIASKDVDNDVQIFHRFNSEIIKTEKEYLGSQLESNYLTYLFEDW